MSSRYEMLDNGCWADFDDVDLSMPATLLYLWTWANPKCGMGGIYRVTHRAMTESRVPLNEIPEAIAELERHRFVFYRDGWLWVRARVKRLKSGGGTVGTSIARDVGRCPVPELRRMFLAEYVGSGLPTGADLDAALREELGSLDAPSMPPHGPLDAPTGTASESEIRGPHDAPSMPPGGGASVSVSVSASAGDDQGSEDEDARARERTRAGGVDQDAYPETLPEEMHDRVVSVLTVLQRVQRERGGNLPTVRGVGLAIAAYPNRDHVAVAGELEHWSTAGNGARKPQKDWARLFRTFLERAPEGTPSRNGDGNGPAARKAAGSSPVAHTGDMSRFKR